MKIFIFSFIILLNLGSSKIVCPRNTDFLSDQSVTVNINSSNWHYFIVNLFKPDSSVKITLKTNATAWLYKGSGLYCPNHAWIFYYKRLRSRWTTAFTIHPPVLDFITQNDLARIQTFGIYAQNSTLVTIQVSEETVENPGVPPFRVLSTILIFVTVILLCRYLLIKA